MRSTTPADWCRCIGNWATRSKWFRYRTGPRAIRQDRRANWPKFAAARPGACRWRRSAPPAKSGTIPDGALQATLELRQRVIREIRGFRPDLVLTHRTNDYHPDHRATGQVVQDASFLVRVPRIVPEVPVLQRDPVVAFMSDLFTKP